MNLAMKQIIGKKQKQRFGNESMSKTWLGKRQAFSLSRIAEGVDFLLSPDRTASINECHTKHFRDTLEYSFSISYSNNGDVPLFTPHSLTR